MQAVPVMSWMGIVVIAVVLILLIVGGGILIAFLFGGGNKTSGQKIGIGIGLLAFGMFFLVCLGAPFMFFKNMESAESQRRDAVRENLKQIGLALHNYHANNQSDQFGNIPVKSKSDTQKKSATTNIVPVKKTTIRPASPPPMPQKIQPKPIHAKKPVVRKPIEEKPKNTATVKKNIQIETPPDWIAQNIIQREGKTYLVLHSDQFATATEAEANLLQKVKNRIKEHIIIDHKANSPFRMDVFDDHCDLYGKETKGRTFTTDARYENYSVKTYGNLYDLGFAKVNHQARLTVPRHAIPGHLGKSAWHIPEAVLQQTLKRQYDETVHRSTDKHEFKMHRAHAQILISEKDLAFTWQALQGYASHREEKIAANTIWNAGWLLGIITVWLGTIATYLRVDTLTKGAYRNRLRLAGAAIVASTLFVIPFIN